MDHFVSWIDFCGETNTSRRARLSRWFQPQVSVWILVLSWWSRKLAEGCCTSNNAQLRAQVFNGCRGRLTGNKHPVPYRYTSQGCAVCVSAVRTGGFEIPSAECNLQRNSPVDDARLNAASSENLGKSQAFAIVICTSSRTPGSSVLWCWQARG
jgi:hypothetical protein